MRGLGWGSSCPGLERIKCVSTIVPQSRPHHGRTNIPQDRGLELSHANPSTSLPAQRRCPRQACCLAEGLLASLLGSGKWLMENIPHFIIVPPGVVQCLDPFQDPRAIPSFPSQLEWKIGLAWANTRGILYNIVVVFAIHSHESAMGAHMFPS